MTSEDWLVQIPSRASAVSSEVLNVSGVGDPTTALHNLLVNYFHS